MFRNLMCTEPAYLLRIGRIWDLMLLSLSIAFRYVRMKNPGNLVAKIAFVQKLSSGNFKLMRKKRTTYRLPI